MVRDVCRKPPEGGISVERLTKPDGEYTSAIRLKLKAYEDTGMEPSEILTSTEMANVACALSDLRQYREIGDLDRLRKLAQADRDDDLNFETDRPRIDFVDRAEKELQKAVNDLEQAARRGAPQADIFNLQRKVEYKQYVLGLVKGR